MSDHKDLKYPGEYLGSIPYEEYRYLRDSRKKYFYGKFKGGITAKSINASITNHGFVVITENKTKKIAVPEIDYNTRPSGYKTEYTNSIYGSTLSSTTTPIYPTVTKYYDVPDTSCKIYLYNPEKVINDPPSLFDTLLEFPLFYLCCWPFVRY